MRQSSFNVLLLSLSLSVSLWVPAAVAISRGDYGPTFNGEGTYYGYTTGGNCAIREPIPSMYNGMVPVAMNNDQYGDSGACGACLLVTGSGKGSGGNPIMGTFRAYVMDRCPECARGDIDLSKGGDGRWAVSWKFIPCPGEKVSFLFEGSNEFYWKLQPRGTKYPILKISIGGIVGKRTQDNFYVFDNGGGFKTPATMAMTDTMGSVLTITIAYYMPDGPVYTKGGASESAPAQSKSGNGQGSQPRVPPPPPSAPKRPAPKRPAPKQAAPKRPAPRPARCVPKWKACTGRLNYWGSSRCCQRDFVCITASSRRFPGKRCEPRYRRRGGPKCVPKWKACTGPNNKFGTSRCCDGFVCRKPWRRSFVGKRCIPRSYL